ncbi:MAG: aminoacetone oxidase family FAD-binding enzyme, partial [Gammaproteobacteria bacterium]
MCALEAGKRGRKVLVLDHAKKPGSKILISGGGSCNFANYYVEPENFICSNPHFCKSAINRYTQWDIIEFINRHNISFHEREHGQLFCDGKASQIVDALMLDCKQVGVVFEFGSEIEEIIRFDSSFVVKSSNKKYESESLVVATGGLSIPNIGASPFGYKIAEQFNIPIISPKAGLVPLTLHNQDKERFSDLSGIAVDATVGLKDVSFRENVLFTHRGLSGPAILQLSSYWNPGETVEIDLLP